MNESFAEVATFVPDEQLSILRELLGYDVLCPTSCLFVRDPSNNKINFQNELSTMYWSRQIEWPWVIHHGKFAKNQRVLEVGSGWSVLKYAIAKRCGWLMCLDSMPESLTKSQITTDKLGYQNIVQTLGDARSLPFEDNYFDRVVCVSVIEHISEDRDKVFSEIKRVLRPGGILLLTMDVVYIGSVQGDFYLHWSEMSDLLINYFGITNCIYQKPIIIGVGFSDMRFIVMLVKWFKPI